MEPNDDDAQMLDVFESYSRPPRRTVEADETPLNRSTLSPRPPRSAKASRLPEYPGYATPNSETDSLNPSRKRRRDASREPSVLANSVANMLSIEAPKGGANDRSEDFMDEIDADRMPPAPYISSLPTGLCYDVRMRYHCELDPPKLRLDYHPEDPRRIFKIYKELCIAGLVKNDLLNVGPLIPNPLITIAVRDVTEAEVCLVHDKKHFDFMRSTPSLTSDGLVFLEKEFDSIYFNKMTFSCALLSAGGAIETCKAVAGEKVKNAIAVIRPPGHHAESNRPMGFCIFDNVSIAAKVCQLEYPETCRKVMILDWDVHHGNGVQQAFYQDPRVLYISLHVHENGMFYPSGPYGDHVHCGAGPGLGKNINIPWPTKGMGDADYLLAFQHVVMPVAYDFDPDLVIIAAGFDAADGDQLGGCFVTPPCYAHMTHMLMGLAKGKLVVCLEGGYNLESISKSALAVTRTLIGEIPDRMSRFQATNTGIETVQMVAMYQSRFWPCLYPKDASQDLFERARAEKMHDVVRYYQANQMKETHNMTSVMIYRDRLSKSFENQVMTTPNFEDAGKLLVVFHDAPEIMGNPPHPVSKKMALHNTWLADGLKHYVDWAVKEDFGVMDVNIPKLITGVHVSDGYSDEDKAGRSIAMNELAVYLWENYIDCNEAEEIYFIGVGTAYSSIINLLHSRENDFIQRVFGMINFISEGPLVPVSDQGAIYTLSKYQTLSKWYRSLSLNLVSNEHLVWNMDGGKKPSKRFGNLVRSPETGLNDMLVHHQEQVQDFIVERSEARGRRTVQAAQED